MFIDDIGVLRDFNFISIIVRILLALLLGGLMGIEREQKLRQAGLRTYVLVCMGSALACITNIYICEYVGGTDPARIPAQVISGIGFLGAGTILVTRKSQIRGLTTAAGLWCCATIGIAVGTGFYSGAIFTTLLIVVSLRFLSLIDSRFMKKSRYVSMYIAYDSSEFRVELLRYCSANSYILYNISHEKFKEGEINYMTVTIKVNDYNIKNDVMEAVGQLPGVIYLEEER